MNMIDLNHTLTADALLAIVCNDVQLVRVKNFYDEQACNAVANALVGSPLFGQYVNAPDIGRVGMAFFEAASSQQALDDYFAGAARWLEQMRSITAPYLSPIDKLRLQLDEAWQPGSLLARLGGRTMFAGLIRVFEAGAVAEPHVDNIAWDAEAIGLGKVAQLPRQLAANIYLDVPSQGGELIIWDHVPDRAEFEARRIPGSYGIHTDGFPEPVVIRPERRELIVFDARNVHAVGASSSRRITASTFIGARGTNQALSIFS